jgi:leucyl aminopeptidase
LSEAKSRAFGGTSLSLANKVLVLLVHICYHHYMKYLVKPTDSTKIQSDMLVVFASRGKEERDVILSSEAKRIDEKCNQMVSKVIQSEGFVADVGKSIVVHTNASRIMVVGVGEKAKLTVFDIQSIGAVIGHVSKQKKAKQVAIVLSSDICGPIGVRITAQHLTEGITLGTYVFNVHKSTVTKEKEHYIEMVTFISKEHIGPDLQQGQVIADAVTFARDLVNEPSSVTTPTFLAAIAKSITKDNNQLSCEIVEKSDMKKLGMGGLLGIAKGSDEEPKFISLSYKGGGEKTIALIGKGITFDAGGLSLKPSSSMETMKLDMAGAAAILGIFQALTRITPKINVVGLIAATENMPSGKAIKPGDVVVAMNGKSIEILNTDAEGRVILADALSFAVAKVKPDAMIDLATLTGACEVALGPDISGLFANNQFLADKLIHAANDSGEHIWQLPLAKEYKELLDSTVADIKNVTGIHYGGAITAALFLQAFVPDDIAWAHIDIAGPAFAEKGTDLTPKGGTGYGVRLILEYLLSL